MAIEIPDQLKEAAAQLGDGYAKNVTVMELLSWFGAERRGYWKGREIRKALNKLKLRTEPDFEEAWINAPVTFGPKSMSAPMRASARIRRMPSRHGVSRFMPERI